MTNTVTTIPAGYRVTFKSWENDADNPSTQVLEGLTKEQAKFYIDFAKLHYSKNGRGKKGYGNISDSGYHNKEVEAYIKAVRKFIKSKIDIVTSLLPEWECETADFDDEDAVSDFAWELKNRTIGTSEFYNRVLGSFKVEKIPVEIVLEDVTHEFE